MTWIEGVELCKKGHEPVNGTSICSEAQEEGDGEGVVIFLSYIARPHIHSGYTVRVTLKTVINSDEYY